MRIIKHGNVLRFTCIKCGCEWQANKDECKRKTRYTDCLPSGFEYEYKCPECGAMITGKEVRADDA